VICLIVFFLKKEEQNQFIPFDKFERVKMTRAGKRTIFQ
jgi:hypothetical protein